MPTGSKLELSARIAGALLIGFGLSATLPAAAQDTTPSQRDAPSAADPDTVPAPETEAVPSERAAPSPDTAEREPTNDARPVAGDPLAISTDIVLLRVVGPWTDEDQRGFSRVIARVSGGQLNLFVQWIKADGKAIETAEVDGAQHVPQLALSEIRIEAGDEDSAVYFDTPRDSQGFRETYVLIIERPGQARFGPATN